MIVAILNPKSGKGKSAEAWAKVRAHLPGDVETLETRAPGHATELARTAVKLGAKTVVAVGGDGTINEVINGFFEDERQIPTQTRLGIVPHGTGSDFKRILDLPHDEKKMAAILHHGEARLVDALKVRYTRMDGSIALRYAINIVSFGMGGAVAATANHSSKVFGGRIAFLAATLRTAIDFPEKSVRLRIDGSAAIAETIFNVAVGNGQYHGAGMWICPGASISDGILDVTVVRRLSLYRLLKALPILYNGGIYTHPGVKAYRAKQIEAHSSETTLIEIDGEPLGRLPIEISIVPSAIRVLLP